VLIDADERHNLNNKGGGLVVAVLNCGSDTDHVNLADSLLAEACSLPIESALMEQMSSMVWFCTR